MPRKITQPQTTQPLWNRTSGMVLFNDARIEWIEIVHENPGGVADCPSHSHNWFELNYVTKGRMETAFGDKSAPLMLFDKGTFFLIPPGLVHSHRYDTEEPHEGVCFRWRIQRNRSAQLANGQPSTFELLNRLKQWRPGIHEDDYGIEALQNRLFHSSSAGEAAVLAVQSEFVRLLLLLSESVAPNSESPLTTGTAEEDGLVRKVDIYLNDLRETELHAERLASSLHMSYGHLARTYKKRTGMTLHQKLTHIRLEKAIEYLRLTKLPIKTVADKAGFGSIYYFSRIFKREYGVSPLRYRSQSPSQREVT
jgi:AraC-like DNA-binding protein/mannose-6-phosphate isomerase-like protein (cupin superfamily)